jgi:hypothetical protein
MKFSPLIVCLALATGCGAGKSDQTASDTLSQRQKDSILAHSQIPNARAVGSAMRVADSTNAGMARADSVGRDSTQ